MDREKVAKGLHQHCEGSMFDRCGECPYYEIDHEPFICRDMLLNDLNDLLKEQEAVEPILEQDSMVCGVCGHEVIWQKMIGDGIWVDEELDYCPHCGKSVKWE